jgi:23S rRNA pseudouridine1911/1915/1917 synthase
LKIEVIFEDNHLLAVVKPVGIPVQKDNSEKEDLQTILKEYLKKKYGKPGEAYLGIVHRLDQPVGGVMVFAKTSKAAARLSEQIRKNEWRKEYLAVVEGVPRSKKEYIEDYLLKDPESNTVTVVKKEVKGAKLAKLSYEVIERTEKRSLLRISLETGRSHQIRVQLASRGFPIVNDHRYGKKAKQGSKIALWAHSLTIIHPVKNEEITFFKELPEEFRNL